MSFDCLLFAYFISNISAKKISKSVLMSQSYNNNNNFMALCPGLNGWGGTRSNTHQPTILIIIQSLSASPTYHDPQHPPCSNYVLGNLFAQPLSMSSLVYLLVRSPPPHIHTFLHPISVFFSQHMPIPSQPDLL